MPRRLPRLLVAARRPGNETTPIDTVGGRSFIINYKGQIVGRQDYGAGSTCVGGVMTSRRYATIARAPSGTTG